MIRTMIIDPHRSVRNVLRERLEFEGYKADVASTLEEAYEKHKSAPCNIVICEQELASNASKTTMRLFNSAPSIILSGTPSIEAAVIAIKCGAIDFVPKPIDMNHLLASIRDISDNIAAPEGNTKSAVADTPEPEKTQQNAPAHDNCVADNSRIEEIIGKSAPISRIKSLIDKVAPSEARVLITGPSGTGKEQVACWLHEKSHRSAGPFIRVNCAAIPSELIESELFGHEKGAFTSAIKQRVGKFEQANGGTLFLDEIGDMSLSAQAKVLRVLQEKKICRVGGDKYIDINVRVLTATNKNLREEICRGNFREDLYHRLSVIMIDMPPLSERRDDIPLLADYFVGKICTDYGIAPKHIDGEALTELMERKWPGNIRELRNVIERLIVLSEETITEEDVMAYALAAI